MTSSPSAANSATLISIQNLYRRLWQRATGNCNCNHRTSSVTTCHQDPQPANRRSIECDSMSPGSASGGPLVSNCDNVLPGSATGELEVQTATYPSYLAMIPIHP